MPEKVTQITKTTRRKRGNKQNKDVVTTTTVVRPQNQGRAPNRAPPSNTTIRKMAKTKSLLTPAGRAWLRLYLNPMARDDPGVIGYPDGSASRSVLADYREDFHFSKPPLENVFISGSATSHPDEKDYDTFFKGEITVMFLQLPVVEKCILVRIYNATPSTFASTKGDFPNGEMPKLFPDYNAYDTDGTILTAGLPIGFLQSVIKIDNIGKHARSSMGFRLIARGNTFIYTVPKLEEQGFVTTAQFEAPTELCFSTDSVVDDVVYKPSTPPVPGDVRTVSSPVLSKAKYGIRYSNLTPSTLVECFHNAYVSKACDGAYVPIYNSSRDIRYQLDYDREIELIGDSKGDENENGNFRLTDTPVKGWNIAVTWFENISPNASIKIKHRSVTQLIAAPGSDISNFTRQEPDEDQLALETAWKVRNKMAHAYPAIYNDWGWLGKLLDSTLSNLPYVGALYGAVKPLIKPSWDWLGDRARDWVGTKINLNQ